MGPVPSAAASALILAGSIVAGALLPILWAAFVEPAGLRNDTTSIALPRWSSTHGRLTIALLADLHVGSPFNGLRRLDRVVEVTRAARPDVVLLAGDFVIHDVLGGRFVSPEAIAERLGRLSARLGVYAVLGNHDWWYDGERVRTALERHGIRVLEDECVRIGAGRSGFWLAGVGDLLETSHDLHAALEGVTDDAPVLLLTHNPDLFPEVPSSVALTLAGHTHGGQVRIPGIGRPVVPSRFGSRYACGHVEEHGNHLFVTPGIGTSLLPLRFLVPPEISVLQISAATEPPAGA